MPLRLNKSELGQLRNAEQKAEEALTEANRDISRSELSKTNAVAAQNAKTRLLEELIGTYQYEGQPDITGFRLTDGLCLYAVPNPEELRLKGMLAAAELRIKTLEEQLAPPPATEK